MGGGGGGDASAARRACGGCSTRRSAARSPGCCRSPRSASGRAVDDAPRAADRPAPRRPRALRRLGARPRRASSRRQQGIFHPYYVSALAPAVAALVGMGLVTLWRSRRGCSRADASPATAWLAVDLLAPHGGLRAVAARRDPGRRRARDRRAAACRAAARCSPSLAVDGRVRARSPAPRPTAVANLGHAPERQQRAGRTVERRRRAAWAAVRAAAAGGGRRRSAGGRAERRAGWRRPAARPRGGGGMGGGASVSSDMLASSRRTRARRSTSSPRPARRRRRRSSSRPARRS